MENFDHSVIRSGGGWDTSREQTGGDELFAQRCADNGMVRPWRT